MPNPDDPSQFLFVETDAFRKGLKGLRKKYPSILQDLDALLAQLEQNPQLGTPLGNDCFKLRLAIRSKNAGKSGGARVITCVKVIATRIYLLTIYDKASQEAVTDKELEQLLKAISA